MKKFLAGGALTAVVLGGMVAMAPAASAHIPNASADCSGLYVDFKSYRGGTDIEVVIDGEIVESAVLPGSPRDWAHFVKHYEFDDDTVAHTWSVSVDAHDDDKYDYSNEGTVDACAEPPAKEVVSPATPEVVAGCAVTIDDVVLPENTESLTYSKNEAGVVAALVSDQYEWIEDLGAWLPQEDGTVLFPAELLLVEEECEEAPAPEPSPSEPTEAAPSDEPSEPVAEEEPPVLAATGATVGGAAAFALLLVGGGVALVIARRRMAKN
ncbi:hypothetical protein [Myceligenerans pegani]|uniref:LPXTG cell wall anchor domain-containing protein n=1 Tax=Myceligenerans pegani TaxID=2776917 RepID=A0ABR9N1G4_9MICO|nr:hypothetical protein [Myceligenerans sp. TRM 65318]MBE1877505.1 hypothetical protein [Myceligenerans sp. TRM 65318]MBE3019776.1 hypothetical protein [Myceligenerans sp. TRM 65318]